MKFFFLNLVVFRQYDFMSVNVITVNVKNKCLFYCCLGNQMGCIFKVSFDKNKSFQGTTLKLSDIKVNVVFNGMSRGF